jgi:hypothetical protein
MSDLRKIYRRVISRNPETNSFDNLGVKDVYHILSDNDDCLESCYLEEKSHCHCGCFGPPGGRCAEPDCGRISCVKCHHHCGGNESQSPAGCGKPICREHSRYLQLQDGRIIPFCRRCYSRLTRRNRWLSIGRAFLSPFIESTENHGE